ncbi:hypothetical protein [Xiamenia xianingshaonis]|uniref:Pyridoxamine 5'-phosphate oxidase putative domain-containing protein n=1 Tax=Xiamenia xianingshaonis TaxID=2682776 RepID=A0ABX0IFX4_9ACTN|nr:hypothetical protein [Xiamenia xianingshaonis]NHM13508.1 hypothetical protein [Xiamenia xianingshaonis]
MPFTLDSFEIYEPTGSVLVTVSAKGAMTFSRDCVMTMHEPRYVVFMLDRGGKKLAVVSCERTSRGARAFSKGSNGKRSHAADSVRVSDKGLAREIALLAGVELMSGSVKFEGIWHEEVKAMVFDLAVKPAGKIETIVA